jgi:hypothetical protein
MKIDTAIGEIYEQYDERSIGEYDLAGDPANKATPLGYVKESGISATEKSRRLQQMLLMAKRDLIRKEMPQNWAEVDSANDIKLENVYGKNVPVRTYYYNAMSGKVDSADGKYKNESAELLYLIIANLNPEALSNFASGEIGDTDGDGLPEFIDGWGNPIKFLRWAPGLYDSEIQPVVYNLDGTLKTIDEIDELRVKNADPIDVSNSGVPLSDTDRVTDDATTWIPDKGFVRGWFLYPLIVSCGPDGEDGLYNYAWESGDIPMSITSANPFMIKDTKDSKPLMVGSPLSDAYKDNIHNHKQR